MKGIEGKDCLSHLEAVRQEGVQEQNEGIHPEAIRQKGTEK